MISTLYPHYGPRQALVTYILIPISFSSDLHYHVYKIQTKTQEDNTALMVPKEKKKKLRINHAG